MREEIVQAVNDNQVIVISGQTGCGKTTQVHLHVLSFCNVHVHVHTCTCIVVDGELMYLIFF